MINLGKFKIYHSPTPCCVGGDYRVKPSKYDIGVCKWFASGIGNTVSEWKPSYHFWKVVLKLDSNYYCIEIPVPFTKNKACST